MFLLHFGVIHLRRMEMMEMKFWWEGTEWLKNEGSWPNVEPNANEGEVGHERKRSTVTLNASSSTTPWYVIRNDFTQNVRRAALVFQFVDKLRGKSAETAITPMIEEINTAERRLWTQVQLESFVPQGNVIHELNVVRDERGLIRVRTKVTNRRDTQDFKYPILLPKQHALVEQLIHETHVSNCHAGIQSTLCLLRNRFWILSGRQTVKKVIRRCVMCQRFSTKSSEVPNAALPEDRVKDTTAFDVTGVDLAGPLTLRNQQKVWIVIFTCAVYRAVHLELVEALSTEDFLLAFIRFCRRKTRPTTVYSDNGSNFRGADNLFKTIDWDEVHRRASLERIDWKFNPPAATWCGGWWERLIQTVKDCLKRVLRQSRVTLVQLETLLCEVEHLMNHRPLTFVTEDVNDPVPLTPAMFLHNLPVSEIPEAKLISLEFFSKTKKILGNVLDELRNRFRNEYLALLVQRGRRRVREFTIGDCVLIGREDVKRLLWPMGRILELIPGRDGAVRVARVKTGNGTLIRPIQRLYPMEFPMDDKLEFQEFVQKVHKKPVTDRNTEYPIETEAEVDLDPELERDFTPSVPVTTRAGRVIRKPAKFTEFGCG